MSEGLSDIFRQVGLGGPRGGFSHNGRVFRGGDSYLERIVSSIRQARVRSGFVSGPSRQAISSVTDYLRSPASSLRSPVSNFASPFPSAPQSGLSSPTYWLSPSAEIGRMPVGRPIGWQPAYSFQKPSLFSRLSGAFRGFGRIVGSIGARIASGVASLGPLGLAVAAAAIVAIAIGATIYYVVKSNKTVVDAVDDEVNFVDPDYDPNVRLGVHPIPGHKEKKTEVKEDPWLGHVPWQRRPGRNLTLTEIWRANNVLQSLFANRVN